MTNAQSVKSAKARTAKSVFVNLATVVERSGYVFGLLFTVLFVVCGLSLCVCYTQRKEYGKLLGRNYELIRERNDAELSRDQLQAAIKRLAEPSKN